MRAMMKAISETLSVMLLTVAFLTITALIYTTIAYQMQNQQAGMFSLLQFKEKQLNEKLSVNVISNTVILYNYGDVAINNQEHIR
jgi:preprotein translocase subunit SecB